MRDEPYQWKDLTVQGQRSAQRAMRQHFAELPQKAEHKAALLRARPSNSDPEAAKANKYQSNRLARLGSTLNSRTLVTPRIAADNRVEMVKRAATTHRAPGEALAGAGWYFDSHRSIVGGLEPPPDDPRLPITSSSIMSPETKPESERRALHELWRGVQPGGPLEGVPSDKVTSKANPGVDHAALLGPRAPNVRKAARVLRGEVDPKVAQDPLGSPKTWGYTEAHVLAAPGTPEEGEYNVRANHLGRVIRGDESPDQGVLDLYGLQGSNEGILSNRAHTAEDTWMQAISTKHLLKDEGLMKAVSDVAVTAKGGRNTGIPAEVSPAAMRHAYENHATHMTADSLEEEYSLPFTVPAVLVQETAWTAARRSVPRNTQTTADVSTADGEYNRQRELATAPVNADGIVQTRENKKYVKEHLRNPGDRGRQTRMQL